MSDLLFPDDEEALAAIVGEAAVAKDPLMIRGGGSRAGWGRPVKAARTLSTARLSGITLYEPAELVIAARAGTPLPDIEATLADQGQRLAFEPADLRAFYGSRNTPTIGGVAAANVAGPRRIEAGSARDSLIGLRAITGRGEVVKSGGRVMKNVTGYDLVKLLSGSYGTLAVFSEVTFKIAPMPETEVTLMLPALTTPAAIAALASGLGSPHAVSGAAHWPARAGEPSITALRLEGFADSVTRRLERLRSAVAAGGDAHVVEGEGSRTFWRETRDLTHFAGGDDPVWRISVRPSDGAQIVDALASLAPVAMLLDWGGGLIWVAGGAGRDDAGTSIVRDAVAATGGHATLVRASQELRARVAVFQPLPLAVMNLTRAVKATFDPHGILNPGRMYADL
ncbi:MAG: glycolate oxidase subunit GlcE [Alphaproteobacteria bacterium]